MPENELFVTFPEVI